MPGTPIIPYTSCHARPDRASRSTRHTRLSLHSNLHTDRHAEFQALFCLSVPDNKVLRLKTGPTGRVSGKKLPVGSKLDIFRQKHSDDQEIFYTFAMISLHFERDVANGR